MTYATSVEGRSIVSQETSGLKKLRPGGEAKERCVVLGTNDATQAHQNCLDTVQAGFQASSKSGLVVKKVNRDEPG